MKTILTALVGIYLLAGACTKNDETPVNEPVLSSVEISEVSLVQHLMPVFKAKCGGCHQREGGNALAVANQKYYENTADILGNVGSFTTAGKSAESGLMKVLDQTYKVGGSQIVMPPPNLGIEKWTENELKLFAKWIDQGAADN